MAGLEKLDDKQRELLKEQYLEMRINDKALQKGYWFHNKNNKKKR